MRWKRESAGRGPAGSSNHVFLYVTFAQSMAFKFHHWLELYLGSGYSIRAYSLPSCGMHHTLPPPRSKPCNGGTPAPDIIQSRPGFCLSMTKVFSVVIAVEKGNLAPNRISIPVLPLVRGTCIIHTGLWMFQKGSWGKSRFLHQTAFFRGRKLHCSAIWNSQHHPPPLMQESSLFILIFRCKFYFHNLLRAKPGSGSCERDHRGS